MIIRRRTPDGRNLDEDRGPGPVGSAAGSSWTRAPGAVTMAHATPITGGAAPAYRLEEGVVSALLASRNAHGERAVGETVEWYTPPAIFDALGMTFDLDPASPGADAVPWIPTTMHYTLEDNGLWRDWHGRVWLNPPYGQTVPDFLARFVHHGHGIALVFSRTETQWWHDTAPKADAVCFLRERVWFIRDDGYQARSQMGSALIAFGDDCAAALRSSGLGWTVWP